MKPFDLEAAKKGAAVCTRDGRDVRIVCFDLKHEIFSFVAIVSDSDPDGERPVRYDSDGHAEDDDHDDLFMKSVKVTKWAIVRKYENGELFCLADLYDSEDHAFSAMPFDSNILHSVAKVEWEE